MNDDLTLAEAADRLRRNPELECRLGRDTQLSAMRNNLGESELGLTAGGAGRLANGID